MTEKKETKRKYTRKPSVKKPDPIPEAKPEKLDTIAIDENIEKAKGEKKELNVVTTSDLKPPKRTKTNKAHDPADDIIITTSDFKPQKWGEAKKL